MGNEQPRHLATWQEAESNAAQHLRELGYQDVRLTPPGADNGIDIRAAGACAQVKREAAQTGRPALQRLVGAAGDQGGKLVFYSAAGYSKPARSYADEHAVALFTYDITGQVQPVNDAARQLSAPGQVRPVGPGVGKLLLRAVLVPAPLTRLGIAAVGILALMFLMNHPSLVTPIFQALLGRLGLPPVHK